MKTHTHTPGPWRIDSKTRFGDYTIAAGESVKTCEFIAKTQSEANARLIAASPELLEIVKAYRNLLRTMASTEGELATFAHIESVLAKAEGVK
jgi:hypothetical protein